MTIMTLIAQPGKVPAPAVSALGGAWSCVGMIDGDRSLKVAPMARNVVEHCAFVRLADGSEVQR